ncbi:KIDINS220 [Branchiostoma lanceolatum]|uniref:KIDINS220 protein n=1 Tax=Branchiostoma lanceolatum TaxID=7740 RepID=A0A8K0EVY7_BRALA|nr:KIDINS220 [Branchiostoma lanceolatum]
MGTGGCSGQGGVDFDDWTALTSAAKEGYLPIVTCLLDRGANIEHVDMGGWPGLMWASYKGHTAVAHEMLHRGANPNVQGQHGVSPIIWASGRGHTDIVEALLRHGAKPSAFDKYGTSALVWACRRGHQGCVRALLDAGADVDTAGAKSEPPLITAAKGGHYEVVHDILRRNPNVNAVDKVQYWLSKGPSRMPTLDGHTALSISAKDGHTDIVRELLVKGAYLNLTDKDGDTVLIHAVKGGHLGVVQALLDRYPDVDMPGADNKTALYWAVEKGHPPIVQAILDYNPNTEIASKGGDTPLLRATRHRSIELVEMLLNKGAKVSATDKRGDTPLHLAIRSRHRIIAELLLRNPRDGRLLYKPNRQGETPYNIDCAQQKSILTQIFGAKYLHPSENENSMLGYDLYSSSLADILSEPTLTPPITVGLYAQWGSGKSFLLRKLQDEMHEFAEQESEPVFKVSWQLVVAHAVVSAILGLVFGFTVSWLAGLLVGLIAFFIVVIFLGIVYVGSQGFDWDWAWQMGDFVYRHMSYSQLLLQVCFCYPPVIRTQQALPIRFLFTDYARLTHVGGETSLAGMIGTLCEAAEQEFGFLVTRLFRVFKPQHSQGEKGAGRFKQVCCCPTFLIVILEVLAVLVGVILLVNFHLDNPAVNAFLIAVVSVVGLTLLLTCRVWFQVLCSLVLSQKHRVLKAAANLDRLRMEGFMHAMKAEVDMLAGMVQCFDAFTAHQTRLVVVVDGLDSCEQDKILHVLDTVHVLFSGADQPFITILAVDPHIIIKAVEVNLHSVFRDSNINGHDYLKNVVHLPFYLKNREGDILKKHVVNGSVGMRSGECSPLAEEPAVTSVVGPTGETTLLTRRQRLPSQTSLMERAPSRVDFSALARRLSRQPSLTFTPKRQRFLDRQLTRQSTFDMSQALVTDTYFSGVTPHTMRRLLNIVALTGRLLRARNVAFKWHQLASWVNLTEQWPYRTSWLIYQQEDNEEVTDSTTLNMLYDRISSKIPTSREVEPLLEIDGDARNFELFLMNHSPVLTVSDLRTFLPSTINLDPNIKTIIADLYETQLEAMLEGQRSGSSHTLVSVGSAAAVGGAPVQAAPIEMVNPMAGSRTSLHSKPPSLHGSRVSLLSQHEAKRSPSPLPQQSSATTTPLTRPSALALRSSLHNLQVKAQAQSDARDPKLKNLDVHDVCDRLAQLEGINPAELSRYHKTIQENNINGPVLLHCELDELKVVMNMKFGDWQLFRAYIVEMRHKERFGHVKVEEEFIEDTMELASSRANLYLPSMAKGGSDTSGSQDSLLAEFGHLSPQEQFQYQGALQAYLDSIENQTVSVRSKIPVRRSPNTTEEKKDEEKYQSRIPRLSNSKHDLTSLHSGSDESLHGQPKSRSHSLEKLRQSPRPRSSTPPRDPSPRTRSKVHTVQSPSYSMKSSFRRSWSGTSPPTVASEAKPSPEPSTDSQAKGQPRLKPLPTDFALVIPNSESSELEDLTDMSPLVADATGQDGQHSQHGQGKISRTLENIASAFRSPRTSSKSSKDEKDDVEPLLNMEEGDGKGAPSESESKTLTQLTHSSSGTLTEVTPLPTPDHAVDRQLDVRNPSSDSALWRKRKHIPSVSDDSPAGEKDGSGSHPQARSAGEKPGAVQDGRNGNGRNRSQERERSVEDNRRNRNDNDRAVRHADSYSSNRPATLSTENEQISPSKLPETFDDSSEKKKGTKLMRKESGRQKSRLPVFRTGSGTTAGQESPAGTKRQSPESAPFGSKRPSTLSMAKADLELKGSDEETGSSGQVSITMNELAATGETVL